MTGIVSVEEGSRLFSSLTVASSRSGGFSVLRVKIFRLLKASFNVTRSDAAFSSRSRRAFSTESMYCFRASILILRALRGALLASRASPRSQAQAASCNLSRAKPAVADL